MRPPRLRCTLFPLIYPPHLLVLPATFGLHLLLQTYPYFRALYVISVRRTKSLLTASFRFHLTMDTLAVQLYTSSLPRRVRDLHPLERDHGAQTKKRALVYKHERLCSLTLLPKWVNLSTDFFPSPLILADKTWYLMSRFLFLCGKYSFWQPVPPPFSRLPRKD